MPAPAALPRELSVSYNGVTIGGTNEHYLLDSYYRHVRSWNHAYVEIDCVVVGASEPDFAARCATLEAAFSDPDHSLTVQLGSSTLVAYSAAPKDYCRPTITKRGDRDTDSGRSRGYLLRIDIDPAATQLSPSGLREAAVDVAYSPARRRTVTISGLWTAIASAGSRSAYEAGVAAYATTVLSALGGTYELAEEPQTSRDRPDHLLAFRRVYLERLWEEGGSSFDDPAIIRQSAIFTRRRVGPGDSPGAADSGGSKPIEGGGGTTSSGTPSVVRRLVTVTVSYSAWIDKGTTDLISKWASIQNWLVGVVQQDFGLSGVAMTEEAPAFDYDENRISAMIVFTGSEGGNTFEQTITVTTNVHEDQVLVPAWTGKPYSCYVYDAQRILTRTVSLRAVFDGFLSDQAARAKVKGHWTGGTDGIDDAGDGRWTRGVVVSSVTHRRTGMDAETRDVSDVQGTITRRWFEKVENGQGGGTSGGKPVLPVTGTPSGSGARAVFSNG